MNIVELRKEWVPFFESLKNEKEFAEFLAEPTHSNAYTLSSLFESTGRIDWYSCGETRGVFGTHEGIVFKFPIFEGTLNDGEEICDFCKMEVRHYRAAKKAGLENLFAECDRLCQILVDGQYYPIYVMKYIDCDSDANLDNMAEWFRENVEEPENDEDDTLYKEYQNDYEEVSSGSSEGASIYFKGILGDELYEEFDEFCFKNDINDIHSENFGYDNGRPVMIDYAGYGSGIFEDLPIDWFSEYGL